jgi:hypothetical protein
MNAAGQAGKVEAIDFCICTLTSTLGNRETCYQQSLVLGVLTDTAGLYQAFTLPPPPRRHHQLLQRSRLEPSLRHLLLQVALAETRAELSFGQPVQEVE